MHDKIVLNEPNTEFGLVLAEAFAVDRKHICLEKKQLAKEDVVETRLWSKVMQFFKTAN